MTHKLISCAVPPGENCQPITEHQLRAGIPGDYAAFTRDMKYLRPYYRLSDGSAFLWIANGFDGHRWHVKANGNAYDVYVTFNYFTRDGIESTGEKKVINLRRGIDLDEAGALIRENCNRVLTFDDFKVTTTNCQNTPFIKAKIAKYDDEQAQEFS